MEWREDFESGLADIDAQHRMIFALVQRVEQLEQLGDEAALQTAIHEVHRFARAHFGCEEQLMRAYGYPGIEQHRIEHASLLQEIAKFRERKDATARELALFMCKWLMSHSLLEDRNLAQHILKLRAEALGLTVKELSAHITITGTPSASFRIATKVAAKGS